MKNPLVIAFAIFALSGCTSTNALGAADDSTTQPQRASVSGYRANVTDKNIGTNNADFTATGIVTAIGDEQSYTFTDTVTGNESAAIYYRDVTIQVLSNHGSIGSEFNLMVPSDFDPKLDISALSVGDRIVVAGYDGEERNGVIDNGAAYVGEIDVNGGTVHSLFVGDQPEIKLATVLDAYGLPAISS
jgi:hypothetical protein